MSTFEGRYSRLLAGLADRRRVRRFSCTRRVRELPRPFSVEEAARLGWTMSRVQTMGTDCGSFGGEAPCVHARNLNIGFAQQLPTAGFSLHLALEISSGTAANFCQRED